LYKGKEVGLCLEMKENGTENESEMDRKNQNRWRKK
jgi:hypothetical protein